MGGSGDIILNWNASAQWSHGPAGGVAGFGAVRGSGLAWRCCDDGRRYLLYHGRSDHLRIAVIWAETEGAHEMFVNGDSFIPGARALELVFKARMFSTVEA